MAGMEGETHMSRIAAFYHVRLTCADPLIEFNHASSIMAEQMKALKDSGLEDAADYIYVGVNGDVADHIAACSLSPSKAEVVEHTAGVRGELPTLHALQKWLPEHKDWFVWYAHAKGAIHTGHAGYAQWRRNMEEVTTTNWRQCVADLESGYESVGSHWMTPEKFPGLVTSPFWGGNFWWSKASFLLTLPSLPRTAITRADFYIAESWIGKGPRRPRVMDYRPGWPM